MPILALLVAAAVLPRLVVLLHERSDLTSAYVDKGDDLARTFLAALEPVTRKRPGVDFSPGLITV